MIYVFNCDKCNKFKDVVRKMENRNDPLICDCGNEMTRIPCYSGGLNTEHPTWLEESWKGTGHKFTTRSEHDKHCRENNIAHL